MRILAFSSIAIFTFISLFRCFTEVDIFYMVEEGTCSYVGLGDIFVIVHCIYFDFLKEFTYNRYLILNSDDLYSDGFLIDTQ